MLTAALSEVFDLSWYSSHQPVKHVPVFLPEELARASVVPGLHGPASGGLGGRGGGGVGHVPLHVYTLQLDSADQRSGPLSCFSEPRKAYKSSRWSEQMVPVSGPVAKPENRLHLLGAHKGR